MLTREQRKELIRRCADPLSSEDVHAPSAWFNFVPPSLVNRDNFVEWLHWAIFSSTGEDGEEFLPEVEECLTEMEQRNGAKLLPGHDPKIKSIRVTLDPVRTTHRPLIWYLVSICLRSRGTEHLSLFVWQLVGFVDTGSFLDLYRLGFQHYSTGGIFRVFPPRPFTAFSKSSPVPLPYWYRPHLSKTKSPVLFLHGIGVPPIPL